MEVLFAAATWLALGLPTGLVLHRYGGAGLLFGVLPFAGCLSLLLKKNTAE